MNQIISIKNIKDQISKGDIKKSIAQLKTVFENSPKLNSLLLQSAEYRDLLKQIHQETINTENAKVAKNKIRLSLLELMDEVETQNAKPAIQKELENAISIINSKNVVTGTITAKGDVHVGDVTHTESQTSKYLRLFLFFFVPILAIAGAYFWYQNEIAKVPLNLKVLINNKTPNPELSEPIGKLTLTYSGKAEPKKAIKTEASFENIPSNFKDEKFRLKYKADGFLLIDTMFNYTKAMTLSVYRNDDLAIIKGNITDEFGSPIKDVKITTDCCNTLTETSGDFLLKIPFGDQRPQQRIKFFKEGYKQKDITTPVIKGEMLRLVLVK